MTSYNIVLQGFYGSRSEVVRCAKMVWDFWNFIFRAWGVSQSWLKVGEVLLVDVGVKVYRRVEATFWRMGCLEVVYINIPLYEFQLDYGEHLLESEQKQGINSSKGWSHETVCRRMPEHVLGRKSTSKKHLLANHMFGASGLLWNLVSFGKFIHDNPFNFSKTFASYLGIPWFSIWVASWIQCLVRNSWERAVMAWMNFTRGF